MFHDDLDAILEELKSAENLVFGVPVYVQLPSAFQSVLNRLVPIIDPSLAYFTEGRTRAELRAEYALKRTALIAVGGWWEKENLVLVDRIIAELAGDCGIPYAGAILRPHACALQRPELAESAQEILDLVKQCGRDLASKGELNPALLEKISRPLIPWE